MYVSLTLSNAAFAQTITPAGLWNTLDDSSGKPEGLIRIDEIAGEFRGTVVGLFSTETPNPVCELCEGPLKNRPIIGMTILRGLRRDGEIYGGGTILDHDEGRTYRCTATLLEGGRKLEVRAYIGLPLLGRTQVWVRGK